MKLRFTICALAAGTLLSVATVQGDNIGLSRGQVAVFKRLKTDFDTAMILSRSTTPREEKPLIDSYELTLLDLKSQRGKLQRGKAPMLTVLNTVHKLLRFDLQLATTSGQQTAALLRHVALLREIETVAETKNDRYLVQFATALVEKELTNRRPAIAN